jgi:hypothetical protein
MDGPDNGRRQAARDVAREVIREVIREALIYISPDPAGVRPEPEEKS